MKKTLLSTAAIAATALLFAAPAMAANISIAEQQQDATVSNSTTYGPSTPATNQTGDVNYGAGTFNGIGLYTLQNTTGYNDAANNATQIAAQVNVDSSSTLYIAGQDQSATVKNSYAAGATRTGDVNYTNGTFGANGGLYTLQNTTGVNDAANNATQLAVQYGNGALGLWDANQSQDATVHNSDAVAKTRTGDINYGAGTFANYGVYTLENVTGANDAANNAMQISAQIGGDDVNLGGMISTQSMDATVSGSKVGIDTTGIANARTGNVNYGAGTFNHGGVYTISNVTGVNAATNNATSISVQLSGL